MGVLFEHIVSLENMQEYNSSVIRSERSGTTSAGYPIIKIEVDLGIKRFQGDYIVQELIPNQKIVASCELSDIKFTDIYTFQEENEETVFEIEDRTELKGLLAMSEFLLGPIMKSQMNQNLKTLLAILEERY